ncbi:MAG TPA: sigma-70 family RNA polymerase sigma factor [Polyangiaceae bacterium]|nr:sigma-70 family RNA polymerase sigma factor [Polyangiaceae bacterium]
MLAPSLTSSGSAHSVDTVPRAPQSRPAPALRPTAEWTGLRSLYDSVNTNGRATPETWDDAALVRAVWAGDDRAQLLIWRRYLPLVRSKLGRSVGGQEVEDQVQEVFLRLFSYLSELRDPAALRSFIIGITLRVAGTELRRRRCRWWLSLTPSGELPEPAALPDGSDAREVAARLNAILGKLSPQSAKVFHLRFVEGKELADVARAMGFSLATVKRHLARVCARVRTMASHEPALAAYVRATLHEPG